MLIEGFYVPSFVASDIIGFTINALNNISCKWITGRSDDNGKTGLYNAPK